MKFLILILIIFFNISAFSFEKLVDRNELVKNFTIKEIENISDFLISQVGL